MDAAELTSEEILRIARAVARRFAKRCWWADVDDMISVAGLAILESSHNWDPQVGIPREGYVARAAALQVRDYLWRQSSPVSGGLHKPREFIAGVHAVPMEDDLITHESNPGAQLDSMNWRLRVRKRLRQIAGQTRDGELAAEVLVRGRPSGEVARESGKDVYGAVHLVRRKVRTDATLYKLWRRGEGR